MKQILRRTGRCFVCLRKNHMSRERRSTMMCNKCNERHNVSICSRGQGRPLESNGIIRPTDTVQPTSQALVNLPSNPVATITASLYCNDARTPALLQTARASVCKVNNHPTETRDVQVIFDCGSQRSYITDEFRNQLMLDSICTDTMLIKTFGSENCSSQVCDVELVVLLQIRESMKMSLLSVPLISESISGQSIFMPLALTV